MILSVILHFTLTLALVSISETRSADHVYRIKEEIPIRSVIGYLNNDIARFRNFVNNNKDRLSPSGDISYRILNIQDVGVGCFTVESNTSRLSTKSRIDRERLCGSANGRGITKSDPGRICKVTLTVTVHGTDQLAVVDIEINDINDHAPVWPNVLASSPYKVRFSEGESAGARQPIPFAVDSDIGDNGLIQYSLEDSAIQSFNDGDSNTSGESTSSRSASSASSTFLLVQEQGLYLQTRRPLDRESVSEYSLTITARDRGIPPRKSKLSLKVIVTDVNDHPPRFTTSIFRPPRVIPETIQVGSLILTLTATDMDSGENGEFSFYFSPTDNSLAQSYFSVRPNGQIIVKRKLDYDSNQHKFEFKVVVKDHATQGYEKSSESQVEIAVSDSNDEYPEIKLYPILTNPDTGNPIFQENKPPLTTVAMIHATDRDFKNSDSVNCISKTADFKSVSSQLTLTTTNENNEFKLITSKSYDRENVALISIGIECYDSANHRKLINLTVEIGDENDNAPEFTTKIFQLYIRENQESGTMLRNRVRAVDRDKGKNKDIKYSIAANKNVPFTIDETSGMVRSKSRLDRESQKMYQFKVVATDCGNIPLSSTATVIVNVENENDNPVIIDPFPKEFRVSENQPSNTKVGSIAARDFDNETIYYFLDPVADSKKFNIHREKGNIITKTQLDRENQSEYHFRVFATDKSYTASILITIFVEDENDNSPTFIMPNISHNSITLSPAEAAGFSLTRIQAIDKDEKENSLIHYSIKRSNPRSLFSIDKTTGVLYLDSPLYGNQLDTTNQDHFSLDIEACDSGKIPRCSVFKNFRIYLEKTKRESHTDGNLNSDSFDSGFSENIIIALIIFLLLMIVVTIAIILLMKRKTRSSYNKTRKDQGNPNSAQNMKIPLEADQCSTEVCDITSGLNPLEIDSCKSQLPTANIGASYYRLAEQYQSGHLGVGMPNFVSPPMSMGYPGDHNYQIPLITSQQQHQHHHPHHQQQQQQQQQQQPFNFSTPLSPQSDSSSLDHHNMPMAYYTRYEPTGNTVLDCGSGKLNRKYAAGAAAAGANTTVADSTSTPIKGSVNALSSPNLNKQQTNKKPIMSANFNSRKPQSSFV